MKFTGIKAVLAEFRRRMFDQCHPVGEVYVQFPGQKSPTELYGIHGGGIWIDITSNYAGLYFRAEGTVGGTDNSSGAFNAGGVTVQGEGLPNITGRVPLRDWSSPYGDGTRFDAFTLTFYEADVYQAELRNYNAGIRSFDFDAHNSNAIYGSSAHVTPVNTAIRIWKRTS